jgi:hypothetical protein
MATANRFARALAATAIAASLPALADMPSKNALNARLMASQPGPQAHASAARAAEAGHERFGDSRLADLITAHQRWMFSIPIGVSSANPLETGANCGLNQDGKSWFLVGPGGPPTFSVSCDVPVGKAIFMPALGYFYEYPCPKPYPQLPPGQNLEAFLRAATAEFIDLISHISMTMDGKPLRLRRAATPMFGFTGAKDWVNYDACITGAPQVALADGYWVQIDPPSPGKHVINLKVTHPWLGSIDGTWTVNVKR